MADDKATPQKTEAVETSDDFEAALEAAITDAYPILRQRLKIAGFAGWHRRRGEIDDLAQQALFDFLHHCRRGRKLPDDSLRYLIVIARNLAKRQYAVSRREPVANAEGLRLSLHDSQGLSEDTEDESIRLKQGALVESVRASIDCLPRRQREALRFRMNEPEATDRELGQKMGIGEDGFRRNVERAYVRLREVIDTQGVVKKAKWADASVSGSSLLYGEKQRKES